MPRATVLVEQREHAGLGGRVSADVDGLAIAIPCVDRLSAAKGRIGHDVLGLQPCVEHARRPAGLGDHDAVAERRP